MRCHMPASCGVTATDSDLVGVCISYSIALLCCGLFGRFSFVVLRLVWRLLLVEVKGAIEDDMIRGWHSNFWLAINILGLSNSIFQSWSHPV